MEAPSLTATPAAAAEQRRLPLSFGQEQLWFLDQLAPGEPTYNVTLGFRLHGPVDAGLLRRSLTLLVARHEALRASFGALDGTPYQVIHPAAEVELPVTDLAGLAAGADRGPAVEPEPAAEMTREPAAEMARELAAEMARPFELATGPLYRFRLLRLAEAEHVFLLSVHHAVIDGWSTGIVTGELAAIYQALAAGAEPRLPQLPAGYADFVAWQREQLATGGFDEQLAYWQDRLANLPVLEFPADRRRPATPTYRGDSVDVDFAADLADRLRATAERAGGSLFVLLATAVNVVASRYTGQHDIPLGISMLARTEPEHEPVVGLFTNMVVLRTDLAGDPTLAELVEQTIDAVFDLQENQDVPFDKVVERLQPVRDASWNPLFQVSMQLLGEQNAGTGFALPGVTAEPVRLTKVRSRFDLTMTFVESGGGLGLHLEYSTDLYDRRRIEAFAEHVQAALQALAADPAQRLSQVPLLTAAARAELLAAGRGEQVDYPGEPVHVQIARYAAEHPDAIAAVCAGAELSYGQLDRRADQLARWLRSRGVGPEQVVAVVVERNPDALVGLLGVLKAGAAFAVLDPANPASRLRYMLRDTAAPVLLTQSALLDRLPAADGWHTLCLDTGWPEVEAAEAEPGPVRTAGRDSLAYVLYTSGSTGQPKGVLIEHRALSSFVAAYQRTFDLGPDDRMLQLAALSFDMSQGEIFTGLCVGATLVQVPPEVGSAPDGLAALMRAERVSYICMSPAMLSLVEPEPYPDLRKIMVGGEACPAEIVNKWNLPGRRMVNVYGPTEAAVGCTEHVCAHVEYRSAPPIGRPHLDRQLYVVDRWCNLVPAGIPGELLIGGEEGLARGYLNQPEQTADRFVADPFRPDRRVYRSGDLVRWNPAGELEYLGRLDSQVKLHGLRVELEEIEAALLAHPRVGTAAVLLRPDAGGQNRLVGYVVADGEPPAAAELRRHLADLLPAYMVPASWVFLDRFPLTSARKVDRAALPLPAADVEAAGAEPAPPGTETEARVAEILAEVLSVPRVSADAGFFDLGGDSLRAMRVVSRLNKAFRVKVNVRTLYRSADVRAIAAQIDQLVDTAAAHPERELAGGR
jgi:amino acid adenylation domain-containing protein